MISPKMTTELKELLLQEFSEEVTLDEANRIGNGLVSYISLLVKMNKENDLNKDKK